VFEGDLNRIIRIVKGTKGRKGCATEAAARSPAKTVFRSERNIRRELLYCNQCLGALGREM